MKITQQPNIVDGFDITIEFNNNFYQGRCHIIALESGKFRGLIHYYDYMPEPFGIYSTQDLTQMNIDAKEKFAEFIQNLPVHKRIAISTVR